LSLAGRSIRGSLSTPLDSLQELSLNYNQNTLNLELLSIGNIFGAKYSWKLEGLDNEWNQPSGNHFINYSNIPSGDYLLKIKLYDSSLSKVIAERTLNLTIVPPFWKTWWFRLFLFLLTVGIIYFILNYYIERLKQQHTEEKVRFFTNTAHDIRTSLTLIKAPIEELTKELNLSDAGRHYLSLATEQARRLSTVVTQLMDFQKVDIGKEQLSLSMVDVVKLVEHRSMMFESCAKSKNIDLQFDSDQECYQSAIDESMMEKIIDNLISNAIKYSHPDSRVQISLRCNPDIWTLEVQDHGIGISKKAQRQLFREFYRGENAINSKIVGSGIGLLLVKNYVALHGGDISCESQENEGSTFKLVIPFKEMVEDETSAKGIISESLPYVIPEKGSQIQMQQEELPKREMRILIVEDNDDLRNFMRYPLQTEFEVLLAEDGVEAWEMIQKEMPDLVVSDVMMPNMDGFELCRLMKSTYETSHIPLIMLTALSGKAEQLHGLGLGADDYLTKPFDMTLLVQRIKSIIRNRAAVKEKALKLIKVPTSNNDQILTNELNDKFLKKMSEVVRANISNSEFGKDDFAAAMNVSSSLLYKKVKALTDQSPTDFIKVVRLDYAQELLQSRKYSVTEVSELCGFSSIGYFSTVFKKHFGKSPTEI
ncbi:MAG: hybrid sensor histidine kinase/response regulator transcription factor, partial [Bacteroidota bacterium]|nr:hybrid sensor histidine kinase/response regulator transcription factor [Bacteroidota bacterium]